MCVCACVYLDRHLILKSHTHPLYIGRGLERDSQQLIRRRPAAPRGPPRVRGGAAAGERGGTARKRSTSGAGQPAERGGGPERGRSRKKQRQLAGGARGVGVDTGKEWRGDGDRMLDTRFGPSSM